MKEHSCVDARPLACSKQVQGKEGIATTNTQLIVPTADMHRGVDLESEAQANALCAKSHGEGYQLLPAASIWGKAELRSGDEYWVNNGGDTGKNCWSR